LLSSALALVLAHCGANWKYCDGGTAATAIVLLVGVIWAGKRAERKKHERRQALEAAGLVQQLASEHEGLRALANRTARPPGATGAPGTPAARRPPGQRTTQGTRKKRKA
jgi:hypothetical protein